MKKAQKIDLVFEPNNTAAANLVRENLSLYNAAVTGRATWYPVNLFLKGSKNEVLGGLLGYIWADWLYVSILWVDESVRGQGHATRLMDAAEEYARECACHSACLDTHSFQARPFYEKRGYQLFGELEDYPKGHKKFFLRKKL